MNSPNVPMPEVVADPENVDLISEDVKNEMDIERRAVYTNNGVYEPEKTDSEKKEERKSNEEISDKHINAIIGHINNGNDKLATEYFLIQQKKETQNNTEMLGILKEAKRKAVEEEYHRTKIKVPFTKKGKI
jgi:hypothetical protein